MSDEELEDLIDLLIENLYEENEAGEVDGPSDC